MTTLEEAARCPRCQEPGKLSSSHVGNRQGTTVRVYHCQNERCRWYGDAGWVVQINEDGTIPERTAGPKQFEKLTPGQEAMARAVLEQNEQDLKKGELGRER